MKTSITVICYRHKVLADGTCPLMLRISKDGKRAMKSIGISVLPTQWDFKREQPKARCANSDLIRNRILQIVMHYQASILEKDSRKEEYTPQSLLHDNDESSVVAQTVEETQHTLGS